MENLIFTVNSVIPLFGVMAIGYFLRQKNFFTPEFLKVLNKFCFKVALPCLLFKNTYESDIATTFNPKLLLFAAAGVVGSCLVSAAVLPFLAGTRNKRKLSAMIQGSFRTNTALFGLPLVINMFGEENSAPIVMLTMTVVPLFNIVAVVLLTLYSEEEGKTLSVRSIANELLQNGLIWGTLIGIAFALAGLRLPQVVEEPIFDMASVATPMAMLSLGGQFDFKGAISNLKYNIVTCVMRLVAIPGVMVLLALAAGFRGVELGSLFVVFCSPTATSSFIMAESMGSDGELAAEIVVSTTLFSMFTIFGWVYLLKSLALI